MESTVSQYAGDYPPRIPTPTGRRQRRLEGSDGARGIERPRSVDAAALGTDRMNVPEVFPRERSEVANRALNVSLSVASLMLLSPVFVLIAIAIRMSSRGPIIYAQTRVGLDRRWRETLALRERRGFRPSCDLVGAVKFPTRRVN